MIERKKGAEKNLRKNIRILQSAMYILKTNICNDQNNEIVPQVLNMGPGYDYYARDSVNSVHLNTPLDYTPNFKSFYLDPLTKVTDIISQGYIFTAGLLVSERFYESIKNYALQPHKAYPVEVIYHEKCLDYYWIHITRLLEPLIDFGRSEFIERYDTGHVIPRSFSNLEEFDQKCKEIIESISGEVIGKRVVFVQKIPAYDLFFINFTSREIFISGEFKDCLLQNKFTGFDILPSENIFSF
jgi:Immunity protein family (Imm11)